MRAHLAVRRRGTLGVLLAAAIVAAATCGAADAPTVNGLFYGDGDHARYHLLGESPGRGTLYYVLDGTTLYVAVVVSTNVNDNVFGIKTGNPNDKPYLESVGWNPVHCADRLIGSDHLNFELTCGGNTWNWFHGYLYDADGDEDPAEADWLSGPGDGSIGGGSPPPGLVSASSLQTNLNSRAWDVTLGGARVGSDHWKSPDADGDGDALDEGYGAGYNAALQWEWQMVYEFSVDVSSCGGSSFTLEVLTAHNSPPKSGPEDVPFDPVDLVDYGDAPDCHCTCIASDGARHILIPGGPILGSVVDAEIDGQPCILALDDDLNGGVDDEDGVVFLDEMAPGATARIQVTGTAGAFLDAWVDFGADGCFGDPGDCIASSVVLSGGADLVTVSVPLDAAPDITAYARFRVSSAGGCLPGGQAPDGEVEDYRVEFPTLALLTSFGAEVAGDEVVVQWTTAEEIGTAGFDLERWDGSRFVPVNGELILATGVGGPGATYVVPDPDAPTDGTLTYRILELEVWGTTRILGPWTVTIGDPPETYEEWSRRCFPAGGAGACDPDADPDRDGLRNRGEFRAGTDPTDPGSCFRLRIARGEDGRLILRWAGCEGRLYRVLAAAGPDQPFEPISACIAASVPWTEIPVDPAGPGPRLYRIALDP